MGKDTLYDLLDYFIDAFLLITIPIFNWSIRVRESNPRKAYAVDPGLAYAVSPSGVVNIGTRLETAVYHELHRRNAVTRKGYISYYRTQSGYEVDFIIGDPIQNSASILIQICADISEPKPLTEKCSP